MSNIVKTEELRVLITPRDKRVMSLLADLGIARESVLHELIFAAEPDAIGKKKEPGLTWDRGTQAKLLRLARIEFIGRHFPLIVSHHTTKLPVDLQKHRSEVVYFLKKAGAEHIERGKDYNKNHERMATHNTFNHRLDIVDVKACLLMALEASENIKLVQWWNEYDKDEHKKNILQMGVKLLDPETKKLRAVKFRPDAAFILQDLHTGRQELFFLEVDEGTETIFPKPPENEDDQPKRGFKDKILAYQALGKQGIKNHFEFNGDGFRVLTINRSQTGAQQFTRTDNLIKATITTGGRERFWFVPFNLIMPENRPSGERILDAPVWYRCNPEEVKQGKSLALKDYLF